MPKLRNTTGQYLLTINNHDNTFSENILFFRAPASGGCWLLGGEAAGDFYDSKTRITNGAFTLPLYTQLFNNILFMIDLN